MKKLIQEKMKIGIRVGDIMTRNFISISPEVSLRKAVKLMVKKRISSLILKEGGILKGILTQKDILWALTKKENLKGIKAKDVCTKKITTIRPSADIYDALKLMKKRKFRRLPVVIKKRLVGYLTLKDILKIEPELFEIVKENYAIKEHKEKIKRKETEQSLDEGLCEECGNFDILYNIDGRLICESCRDEM